ncbi:glycoside hydrolase family 13 protein [Actinomyces sp. MRS3W]|uniref:glycoside hydrolase family 13 protein n=1 Tax=Actinomyces sp. MRS3W TaxID=2800796 RepID=UPI0028FD194D|nr:glycoside hydrolase family 13 protein [Actinomyces sp. MRS3W]MDU0349042.1 glycoside hydrolase family 13 protein [Actinomyces sp. MRS3W]
MSQPHHDTGPAYLLGTHQPGAELTARLWVPEPWEPERVIVRQVVDGEPALIPATLVAKTRAGSWWEATIRLVNPVNHYRFLLLSPHSEHPYVWFHAAGLADHDVPDATDFQVLADDDAPDWVLDAVCYQIFPDRFAAHTPPRERIAPAWAQAHEWLEEPPVAGPPSGAAWYGGDLDGIADHLDYLQELGINTLYLTPIFPAGSLHRYDATTFDHVDELLGGDAALVRLSSALHERGMRLLLDLTTNHTGVGHDWFRSAVADEHSPEAGFYTFDRHPDQYVTWMGVKEMPKLNHCSDAMRDRLLRGPDSVTAHWLLPPFNADGWRTDVANMTGRSGMVDLAHQAATDMRATMRQVEATTGRPLWLVAEHGHDASGDLTGPGWQGTMNYHGFTRPLWSWLASPDPDDGLTWLGIPTGIPSLPAQSIAQGVREYAAHMPATSIAHSMNLLGSHDTPRIRTVVGSREAQLVAATALFTAPGVPTVFSGDELGATGRTGEHARTTMPWTTPPGTTPTDDIGPVGAWGAVDRVVLERYRHLSRLRHELPALRRGGMRWVYADDGLIVWMRTHPDGDVLVVLARAACAPLSLPLATLPAGTAGEVEAMDGVEITILGDAGGELTIHATAPGSAIVLLHPALPRSECAYAR